MTKSVNVDAFEREESGMESKQLRQVKKGEFFRLRDSDTSPVWTKTGCWTRQGGKTKYECEQFEDAGHCNFYGADRLVYVGFTY